MAERYRLDWLYRQAEGLQYGSFEVKIKVSAGQIVSVETVPGSERKVITLQDQARQQED